MRHLLDLRLLASAPPHMPDDGYFAALVNFRRPIVRRASIALLAPLAGLRSPKNEWGRTYGGLTLYDQAKTDEVTSTKMRRF